MSDTLQNALMLILSLLVLATQAGVLIWFFRKIKTLTDYEGGIHWDSSKPDGQPRRCLDMSRTTKLLHWQAEVSLEEGLRQTIDWFRNNRDDLREVHYH